MLSVPEAICVTSGMESFVFKCTKLLLSNGGRKMVMPGNLYVNQCIESSELTCTFGTGFGAQSPI